MVQIRKKKVKFDLNIRDFPSDLHRAIVMIAAERNITLRDLVIRACRGVVASREAPPTPVMMAQKPAPVEKPIPRWRHGR